MKFAVFTNNGCIMLKYFITILVLYSSFLYSQKPEESLTEFVNPFIGTQNSGNTFPGAVLPWGMVSVSPHTSNSPSGYIHGNEFFYGFGHNHLSGTGCADLGSIIVTASQNDPSDDPEKYKLEYSDEAAEPGFYSLRLDKLNLKIEVTASKRGSIIRFIAPSGGDYNILFDLGRSLAIKGGGSVKMLSDSRLEGFNISGGFCGEINRQTTYFAAEFNRPSSEKGIISEGNIKKTNNYEVTDSSLVSWFRFKFEKGDTLLLKAGISYTNTENAWKNLNAEIPAWDFHLVYTNAQKEWNDVLRRIIVEGKNDSDKVKFYSAMYHMLIHPNIISDLSGDYPLMGRKGIGNYSDRNRYTVFSLWDTYRTLHPFMTLVFPEVQSDFVKTMIDMYKENGFLPKWELTGAETFMMVGDPASPVIADSYVKGIKDFDAKTAFDAMLKPVLLSPGDSAPPIRAGYHELLEYKYIPFEQDWSQEWWVWGPVSTTLEYNFADWSISKFAEKLGHTEYKDEFLKRSRYYKNLFDKSTLFFRPKMKDGSWLTPFDSLTLEGSGDWHWSGGPGYVEGNAWTYAWFVPHDIDGLFELYGSEEVFFNRLNQFFEEKHFTIGNEPDIHYPYLFRYLKGKENLTNKIVHNIMNNIFSTGPGGLPGDDDCGTISGWFVFSSMGFYPLCPASEEYIAGYPLFDKITISLNNSYYKSSELIIEKQDGPGNEIMLDGKRINNYKINHHLLTSGKKLIFR
jgi:predicted alpha-1,2-mannosidase